MGSSFYTSFMESDVATQKLYALTGCFALDTLFFDFVYEVIREKLIIGTRVLSDSDIRIFFKEKQLQDDLVAKWTDQTLHRLGASYKTQLYEAGLLEDSEGKSPERKIRRPIMDPSLKHWLEDYGFGQIAKALEGIR